MASIETFMTTATTLRSHSGRLAAGSRLSLAVMCLALLAAAANASAAGAETADGCVFRNGIRAGDEIALVNTRAACGTCNVETLHEKVKFESYAVCDEAGTRRWQPSNLEEFVSFDAAVPTVIYIHGNQMTNGDAKCQGLALYRKLVNYGGCGPRIRFVIFSWPSAKVAGLLRDVRVKALRTAPAGCQLAWLLDQMPAETPVSLIGFSFGARIITAGLHVLGGGQVSGMGLEDRVHPDRAPMNVVLVAAAVHAHWLGKGQCHGLAMTQVDRMFMLNNCRDIALKYYHFSTSDGSRPQALGLCGPTNIDSEYAAKIRKRDVSRYAGSEHDLFMYLCAPGATGQVWDYATTAPGATVAGSAAAN